MPHKCSFPLILFIYLITYYHFLTISKERHGAKSPHARISSLSISLVQILINIFQLLRILPFAYSDR